jgi:uncharacterized protein
MEPLEKQLDLLRRKIARIDSRYAAEPRPEAGALPDGREVETAAGKHWEIERIWPAHSTHGCADVGALSELPPDLLTALANESGPCAPPERWAFLDTETSGLSGGSGAFAFLVGVGWISRRGFELKQFFMRDHGEEPSLLTALAALLEKFDVMVTYNGRSFDQPLLETRFRLARIPEPFPRLQHVDLLYSARRLWRLALESCRLQELEQKILGVERHGDVPGGEIPARYFEYLVTKDARPLQPVISHNATDILSLACLTAVVPAAFRDPQRLSNAAEMAGLARWFAGQGRAEEAIALMRGALSRPLAEPLLYETLWRLAELERKMKRTEAAVELWKELSTVANPWRAQACEKLAIHYERGTKDYALALELTLTALRVEETPALRKRESRLRAKAGKPEPGRLL